jgi:hypothetical protein
MALAFDDRKLVLAGIHEVSLEVVKEHFARFQKSDRRIKLFEKLRSYLDAYLGVAAEPAAETDAPGGTL